MFFLSVCYKKGVKKGYVKNEYAKAQIKGDLWLFPWMFEGATEY